VGIVSVFDTDYATAQRYELQVVSAPPFQAFPAEALSQHSALVEDSEVIIVAPIFFGPGNLEPLQDALRAARSGKTVLLIDDPPPDQRDLSDGRATTLLTELASVGAKVASGTVEAVELLHGFISNRRGYPT
jgi:iron complex transport system ATP-binding protein